VRQALAARRQNLGHVAAQLEQLDGVAAAQAALELLLPAGDAGGALDVLADLGALVAAQELQGLHAFRCDCKQLTAQMARAHVAAIVHVLLARLMYDIARSARHC